MERFSLNINRLFTHASSVALALLMFLTVADVLGRYLFNRPVPGTFELTEMSMVLIVFLALGLAQHYNEHISLDLAYTYFSARQKKVINVIVGLVNFAVVSAISWQLYRYAARMLEGNYTTAVLGLPIYPFVIVAVAGAVSYLISIICDFGKAKKENRP